MDIRYEVNDGAIRLFIPAANDGKFRFKKRGNHLEFRNTFSTREESFDGQAYLEWQIGYDVTVKDFEDGKKSTELTSVTFEGSNRKRKYPFELSEIVFKSIEIGILRAEEVLNALKEVADFTSFIDEKKITASDTQSISMNGLSFKETSIMLPTYFMTDTLDGTQIEVCIQKQQYASGTQPMIYFCIPLEAFENYASVRGRPSVPGDEFVYVINKHNVMNALLLMKVFAMASKRHHHDITEILKLLIGLAQK
jgi:hypothetical protein